MTDRSEAISSESANGADDAILLDVIVSPEKKEAEAGTVAEETSSSLEGGSSSPMENGNIVPSVSSVSSRQTVQESVSGDKVRKQPASDDLNESQSESVFKEGLRTDESDTQTSANESLTAESSAEVVSGSNGQSGQNRTVVSMDGGEPIFEGDSSPWAPSSPKIIDPEADADEIPPLATGRGTGGTLPPSGNGAEEDDAEEKPMTLLEHLGELRSRLVRSFLAIAVAFFVCYAFAKDLFYYLSLPLLKVMPADAKFIYTGVAEGFFVDLKVSFVAAVFVACPFLFYQIWAFIAPGLYEEEKRYVTPLAFCSAFFFLGGATFCYFVVFPFAFKFFMSYSTENIVAMLSINEYLGFALKMLIAFGLIFEMPLFSFFLSRMGIVTAARMRSVRKYAVLAVFIIAAILTPPDVFSQIMMAVPMLFLYEISIFVAAIFGKRAKSEKEEKAEDAEEGERA